MQSYFNYSCFDSDDLSHFVTLSQQLGKELSEFDGMVMG